MKRRSGPRAGLHVASAALALGAAMSASAPDTATVGRGQVDPAALARVAALGRIEPHRGVCIASRVRRGPRW